MPALNSKNFTKRTLETLTSGIHLSGVKSNIAEVKLLRHDKLFFNIISQNLCVF